MSEYIIEEHGDPLEKLAADFIHNTIPYYAEVWKLFIGHQGNGKKADLPGFSDPEKRDRFSEHTYTILESAFINYGTLKSGVFEQDIRKLHNYFEFNKSLVAFFAFIGRIKDNLEKASNSLIGAYAAADIREKLDSFYQPRNVVLHGQKIPFSFDQEGLTKIPRLYKISGSTERVWDDKSNSWEDYPKVQDDYACVVIQKIFDDLMIIVNDEFAKYHDYIQALLKKEKLFLVAPDKSRDYMLASPSGSTQVPPHVNIIVTTSRQG